jgi:hypothetical protein
VVLSLLFLLLLGRARSTTAFRDVVSERQFYLMIGQWNSGIIVRPAGRHRLGR